MGWPCPDFNIHETNLVGSREKLTSSHGYMKRFVKEHWTQSWITNRERYPLKQSEGLEGKVRYGFKLEHCSNRRLKTMNETLAGLFEHQQSLFHSAVILKNIQGVPINTTKEQPSDSVESLKFVLHSFKFRVPGAQCPATE
eukprot:767126-Hanusia_phi.AAC.5